MKKKCSTDDVGKTFVLRRDARRFGLRRRSGHRPKGSSAASRQMV
ncbi:hypothetical protein [Sorangium atrum]|uniref:50S ribosomal protein L34 n=1 Tax=Sorangium atrum TaxID=2995308 RepID=A0ABT5BYS3_9BACT|nr:hypothetical protein [Sorangium aterium]MDC0679307.1 hypothetical protein [Sorangium aterium]